MIGMEHTWRAALVALLCAGALALMSCSVSTDSGSGSDTSSDSSGSSTDGDSSEDGGSGTSTELTDDEVRDIAKALLNSGSSDEALTRGTVYVEALCLSGGQVFAAQDQTEGSLYWFEAEMFLSNCDLIDNVYVHGTLTLSFEQDSDAETLSASITGTTQIKKMDGNGDIVVVDEACVFDVQGSAPQSQSSEIPAEGTMCGVDVSSQDADEPPDVND